MEQFCKENISLNSQELLSSIDPEIVAEVILPVVIEKLKVEGSTPENEFEQNIANVAANDAGFEGSEFAEEFSNEDLKDVPPNSILRSKKYSKITDDQRRDFIDAVENNGEKIIHAAKRFNINYSSAKSILNVFKSEGRSLKKMTRRRNEKDEDEEKSSKSLEISGNKPTMMNQAQNTTSDVSTQTHSEGDPQQDNYLLALRDRLLASKTEKRENPYSNLFSHEAIRYPGNLNDFPQHQIANAGLTSFISQQGETKNQTPISFQAGNSPGDSQLSQDYLMASQQGQPILSFPASSNLGQGPQSYSYQQASSSLYQTGGQKRYEPQMMLGGGPKKQNYILNMNYPQTMWKNTYNEDSNGNRLNIPQVQQTGNSFSSMSYTGPNQAQYMMNQTNEKQDGQKNQVHYVQPVMYMMPSSVNQLNFGAPIYQNIQNYSPHQNTYLYYGQGQDKEQGQNQSQNTNLKRG